MLILYESNYKYKFVSIFFLVNIFSKSIFTFWPYCFTCIICSHFATINFHNCRSTEVNKMKLGFRFCRVEVRNLKKQNIYFHHSRKVEEEIGRYKHLPLYLKGTKYLILYSLGSRAKCKNMKLNCYHLFHLF